MPAESKYEPRFCDMLIDHMKEGKSFSSFGIVVGVGRQTLYNWKERIPEFRVAYEQAWCYGLDYYETLLQAAITGTGHKLIKDTTGLNATALMMLLKNRFREEYMETKEVINRGSVNIGGAIGIGHLEGDDLRGALDEARARRRELEDRIARIGGHNPFKDGNS